MLSQMLTSDRFTDSSSQATVYSAQVGSQSARNCKQSLGSFDTAKAVYRADQQIKFLHLQAETESLFQQLQTLKRQRIASDC